MLTAADGSTFTHTDALYVLGIKNNSLLIFALAKSRRLVKFMDDRCTAHDLSYGDSIIAYGLLCQGFTNLIVMRNV